MSSERERLCTFVIRNLMLEALSYTGDDVDPEGNYFKQYGYSGTQSDLFRLTEGLAIKKGFIPGDVELGRTAWACTGNNLFERSNMT